MCGSPTAGVAARGRMLLMHRHSVPTIRNSLSSRSELIDAGWTDRSIRSAVKLGSLRRVHHGWYMSAELWDELFWISSTSRMCSPW
jgi:hypothetical protein